MISCSRKPIEWYMQWYDFNGMAIYHGCYAKPDVYSNYSLLVKTLEKFTKF